jgi:hypothetical protein
MHRPDYCSDPTCEQLAKALVAEPYPVQILSAEPDDETELLTGICEDLSVISPQRGSGSSQVEPPPLALDSGNLQPMKPCVRRSPHEVTGIV